MGTFRLRRYLALLVLGFSLMFWFVGVAVIADAAIGLLSGKPQWVKIESTTYYGIVPVFGTGLVSSALGYLVGKVGLFLWRSAAGVQSNVRPPA